MPKYRSKNEIAKKEAAIYSEFEEAVTALENIASEKIKFRRTVKRISEDLVEINPNVLAEKTNELILQVVKDLRNQKDTIIGHPSFMKDDISLLTDLAKNTVNFIKDPTNEQAKFEYVGSTNQAIKRAEDLAYESAQGTFSIVSKEKSQVGLGYKVLGLGLVALGAIIAGAGVAAMFTGIGFLVGGAMTIGGGAIATTGAGIGGYGLFKSWTRKKYSFSDYLNEAAGSQTVTQTEKFVNGLCALRKELIQDSQLIQEQIDAGGAFSQKQKGNK